jgi:uncharacterized protein
VRLTMVVEASVERLAAVVAASPNLTRLVRHRWLFLAALSPNAPEIYDVSDGEPRLHAARQPLAVVPGPSANWFRGKRGHLGFVQIAPDPMR